MNTWFVYIVTNPSRSTLYTGVTNDLERRLTEHYNDRGNNRSFAGKYYCYNLIFYDGFPSAYEAIQAEKYIKGKSRMKKLEMIMKVNPSMSFLNSVAFGKWPPDNA